MAANVFRIINKTMIEFCNILSCSLFRNLAVLLGQFIITLMAVLAMRWTRVWTIRLWAKVLAIVAVRWLCWLSWKRGAYSMAGREWGETRFRDLFLSLSLSLLLLVHLLIPLCGMCVSQERGLEVNWKIIDRNNDFDCAVRRRNMYLIRIWCVRWEMNARIQFSQ